MHIIKNFEGYVDVFCKEFICEEFLTEEEINSEIEAHRPQSYPCLMYFEKSWASSVPAVSYLYKDMLLELLM